MKAPLPAAASPQELLIERLSLAHITGTDLKLNAAEVALIVEVISDAGKVTSTANVYAALVSNVRALMAKNLKPHETLTAILAMLPSVR